MRIWNIIRKKEEKFFSVRKIYRPTVDMNPKEREKKRFFFIFKNLSVPAWNNIQKTKTIIEITSVKF